MAWSERRSPGAVVVSVTAVLAVAGVLGGVLGLAVAVVGPVAPAAAQEGPANPADVREDVRDVMSRREFSYEKSITERIGDWLAERLEDLFGGPAGAGGTFGGGVGSVIAWVIIGLAVAGAVAAVVVALRRRQRRGRDDGEPALSEVEVEHRRSSVDWAREAARFESEGRWKEALRARFRELVRTLVDRRQVPDVAGRTTGELRGDLSATTPGAAEDFDTACLLFELAWYAHVPAGAEEVRRLREAAAVVLAAPVQDRFGGAEQATPATVEVPA